MRMNNASLARRCGEGAPIRGPSPAPPRTPGRSRDAVRADVCARYVEPEIELLCRVALTLTGHHADAEVLTQDTLIRAYRAADRFDGAHPRTWLLTILRNTHRKRRRAQLPILLRDDPQDSNLLDCPVDSRRAEVADEQFSASVTEALRTQPDKYRTVVALVDGDGLSYDEAALVLGVSLATVISRLHRARARIRAQLVTAGLVPQRSRP